MIPKAGKMYQMNIKYLYVMSVKYVYQHFPMNVRLCKIDHNWDFGFENKPSGNPGSYKHCTK
jgi:hypothetical protein